MQARQKRPQGGARPRTITLFLRQLLDRGGHGAFARVMSVGAAALSAAVLLALPSGAGLMATLWLGTLRGSGLTRAFAGTRRRS